MRSKTLAAASGSVRIYRFRAFSIVPGPDPIHRPMSIAMKPLRTAAALALLLSAAACDGLGTDPDRGALVFRYSGDISGTFEASGEYPAAAVGESYATGGANGTTLVVEAQVGSGEPKHFFLYGGPGRPGTYTLGPQGDFRGSFIQQAGTGGAEFAFTAGTLVVLDVTDERIRGRFSGTGVHRVDPARTVTITDGFFDVPNHSDPGVID